jgi:IMP cyclohydrolase
MYVGRIVVVGRSHSSSWAGYRVSSRAFPNRRAEVRGRSIMVSPLDPHDLAKNPYIAYNCIRADEEFAVVANGTQADTIFEKIGDGMRPLDAIAGCLVTLGYERDELDTPRLAGAVLGEKAWLGIARRDELHFKEYHLRDGDAFMVATYEKNDFEAVRLSCEGAADVAKGVYELPFEMPVCSAAAFAAPDGFELAAYNPI